MIDAGDMLKPASLEEHLGGKLPGFRPLREEKFPPLTLAEEECLKEYAL